MYRLLYICTDHTASKETGIMLLEKTLVITLSAVASLRTAVLGWDFLVLLFFCFYFIHLLFWKQKADILKADTADGTLSSFRTEPSSSCPEFHTAIHFQTFSVGGWPVYQQQYHIYFSSWGMSLLFWSCWEMCQTCSQVLAPEECSRESTELSSVLYLPWFQWTGDRTSCLCAVGCSKPWLQGWEEDFSCWFHCCSWVDCNEHWANDEANWRARAACRSTAAPVRCCTKELMCLLQWKLSVQCWSLQWLSCLK